MERKTEFPGNCSPELWTLEGLSWAPPPRAWRCRDSESCRTDSPECRAVTVWRSFSLGAVSGDSLRKTKISIFDVSYDERSNYKNNNNGSLGTRHRSCESEKEREENDRQTDRKKETERQRRGGGSILKVKSAHTFFRYMCYRQTYAMFSDNQSL